MTLYIYPSDAEIREEAFKQLGIPVPMPLEKRLTLSPEAVVLAANPFFDEMLIAHPRGEE